MGRQIFGMRKAIWLLALAGCLGMPQPAMPHSGGKDAGPRWEVPGGEPRRGPEAITRHGCFSCHAIPGIRRAKGRVGPRLHGIREQMYIGGMLANSPGNMAAWIRNPQRFAPGTAMPDLDVGEQDALDITAYLFKASD